MQESWTISFPSPGARSPVRRLIMDTNEQGGLRRIYK